MEDIIAHARELGKKIAAHPRCSEFMAAAKAVAEDLEAQKILKAYQDQARRVQELSTAGKPIEVDDKHRLTWHDLQGSVLVIPRPEIELDARLRTTRYT